MAERILHVGSLVESRGISKSSTLIPYIKLVWTQHMRKLFETYPHLLKLVTSLPLDTIALHIILKPTKPLSQSQESTQI
jgi:hypothetical protein